MANPLLVFFVQVALILEFKLIDTVTAANFIDTPFIARCDVNIEPADMMYMMNRNVDQLSQKQIDHGCEGMLQLKKFTAQNADEGVDKLRMEIWKNAMRNAAKNGHPHACIGLVDFVLKGSEQRMPFAVEITVGAADRVRSGQGFECHSALMPGLKSEMPLSVQSNLEYVAVLSCFAFLLKQFQQRYEHAYPCR